MSGCFRGLTAGLPLEALRRRCAEPPYAAIWERLEARVRETAALDAASDGYIGPSALGWHSVTPAVVEAAAVWKLRGDPDALAHVERCIGHLAEIYEGSAESLAAVPPHLRRPVLSHGEIALAADLCQGDIGPPAAETLGRLLRAHIVPSVELAPSLTGHSQGSNIACTRNINAGIAALVCGREAGCAGWEAVVDGARDTCIQYLRHAIDDDGFGYEGCGYVQDMLGFVTLFADLLRRNGRDNLFATEPRLRRAATANLHLLFPDRRALVNIGDCGIASPVSMAWLLLHAQEFSDPLLLGLWQEFDGPDVSGRRAVPSHHHGAPYFEMRHLLMTFLFWDAARPATPVANSGLPTAIGARGTGITAFRTSWGRDAVYASFLASGRSHTALTHCHHESGHFSIFAYGEYLAIDTGRYNGGPDQHSILLVDSPDQTVSNWGSDFRGGRLARFERAAWLDYARVESGHQRGCIWADRHFLFVRTGGDGAYVVVADNVNPDNAKHTFWWQLQAHPATRVAVTGPRSAEVRGERARLDLAFAIPGPEVFPRDPHALALKVDDKWWSWPYGKDENVAGKEGDISSTSIRRPRLLGELAGLNGQIAAVIVPRRTGEAPLPVRTASINGVIRLDIEVGAFTDTILLALDHGCVRIPGAEGFTTLAAIRRPAGGGPTDYWTADGSPLRIDLQG